MKQRLKKRITPFVVRPLSIVGTPRTLAGALNWRVRKYLHPRRPDRVYNYAKDFLMAPVAVAHLRNAPPEYTTTLDFLRKNKYGQRKALEAAGIPVPDTHAAADSLLDAYPAGTRFVVRPLRHAGGSGYRVTDNARDFVRGSEYISELYPKRREYRVVFCFGKPVIWLRKHEHEGVSPDEPWGHVNSTFQTVHDVASCKLSSTDCVSRLAEFPPIRGAHIIAADILYNRKAAKPYVVLELNACPGLTIDDNRDMIVRIIRDRHTQLTSRLASLNAANPRSW